MQEHRRRRRQEFPWLVVVIGLFVVGAFFYFNLRNRQPTSRQVQMPVPPPPAVQRKPVKPVIKHPVPPALAQTSTTPKAPPLPSLDQSDTSILGDVTGLLGREAVQQFLVKTDIIRNVVVTVDNLPRRKVAPRVWPVHTTPGKLKVERKDDTYILDPANVVRYRPFMEVVKAVDPEKLAALYLHYYPLFQQAYQELGYPHGYFNDRLVQVIDHLLKTPDVTGAIRLIRPSVYYKYADAGLETRSAGQKILIRLGSANEAIIKAKLRAFRKAIVVKSAQ